jgi:hypothetical protein
MAGVNRIRSAVLVFWTLFAGAAFAAPAWPAESSPSITAALENETFIMMTDGDTVMFDRCSRTSKSVEGTVSLAGSPWHSYSMTLGGRGRVTKVRVGVYPPNATAKDTVAMRVTADLEGDSVRVGHHNDREHDERMFPASELTMIGVDSSIAALEQAVRRFRGLGSKNNTTLLILLPEHGQVWPTTITSIGADSTRLVMSGDEWRFATDKEGHILGGRSASGKLEVRRVVGSKGH